jgi:hypothetical protein
VIDVDSTDLDELLEVVGQVVSLVLEDRTAAQADGRVAITLWEMLGHHPHALAMGERALERDLHRIGSKGE